MVGFIIKLLIVMWWIALVVVAVIILIIIIAAVVSSSRNDRGDYGDGGGTQFGGGERIPFFTPANDRAGIWGEKLVNYHLRPLLREDEYLLANLLLPIRNGYKTEIDCILSLMLEVLILFMKMVRFMFSPMVFQIK